MPLRVKAMNDHACCGMLSTRCECEQVSNLTESEDLLRRKYEFCRLTSPLFWRVQSPFSFVCVSGGRPLWCLFPLASPLASWSFRFTCVVSLLTRLHCFSGEKIFRVRDKICLLEKLISISISISIHIMFLHRKLKAMYENKQSEVRILLGQLRAAGITPLLSQSPQVGVRRHSFAHVVAPRFLSVPGVFRT